MVVAECLIDTPQSRINGHFKVKSISRPGETTSSSGFESRPGGKGANQAVAIAKAGGSVDFIGIVGPNGGWLVDELRGHGVGVDKMVIAEVSRSRSPMQIATLKMKVERYNWEGTDPSRRRWGELDWYGNFRLNIGKVNGFPSSTVLHHAANHIELPPPVPESLEGYTHLLLQNEIPLTSTVEYLSAAHELGIVTIMNPSPLPTPEQTRGFPWGKLNWLIVNEGEARDLLTSVGEPHSVDAIELAMPPGGVVKEHSTILSAHEVGSRLTSHPTFKGVNIICTLGSVGLLAFVPLIQGVERAAFYLPAAKLDGPVVDTTGAGDCFTGYFVSGLMSFEEGRKDLVSVLNTSIKVRSIGILQSDFRSNPNTGTRQQGFVYREEER